MLDSIFDILGFSIGIVYIYVSLVLVHIEMVCYDGAVVYFPDAGY